MGTTLIEHKTYGSKLKRLTAPQRAFVDELLADDLFKPTEAARKAGYKNPPQAANKLMKNRQIAAALGKAMRERHERCELKADEVLAQLARALYLDPLDLFERDESGAFMIRSLEDVPVEVRRCITKLKARSTVDEDGNTSVYLEVELMSKDAAMGNALKHLGLISGDGPKIDINVGEGLLAKLMSDQEGNGQVVDAKSIEAHVEEQE